MVKHVYVLRSGSFYKLLFLLYTGVTMITIVVMVLMKLDAHFQNAEINNSDAKMPGNLNNRDKTKTKKKRRRT